MGIFTEYIDRNLNMEELFKERKKQLKRISKIRGGRDLLVIAADMVSGQPAPININYPDLLPVVDQISNMKGSALDLILETPGGSGETAEDIIRAIRSKYDDFAVIIPGRAKSAGTIMALAGNEILMEPTSSLGPIDAQLAWEGKGFSADALLKGVERIKGEVTSTGALNRTYIPMLQRISPGELESAQNALDFATDLVKRWLVKYKFQSWDQHSSTGNPVTLEEKEVRAEEIAVALCDQSRWFTHGRSIKIDDLKDLRLNIVDYSENKKLADAMRRYYTLLMMTFNATNIYKIFETPDTQIQRHATPEAPIQGPQQVPAIPPGAAKSVIAGFECGKCKLKSELQADFTPNIPLKDGAAPFPPDNNFVCPGCEVAHNLIDLRRQIEAQFGMPIVH